MKKIAILATAAMLSTSAFAADLGVISQPAPVGFEPVNDWTGFYAGVFGSIGAADFELVPAGLPGGFLSTGRGALGGVQVGYDYQLDSFVLGAVADIALSGVEGRASFGGGLGGFEYTSRLEYLGTVRARAGFLPTDDLLVYAHGGFAYGRSTPSLNAGGLPAPGFVAANRTGWTVGAGLEYAVTENISVQTEYATLTSVLQP